MRWSILRVLLLKEILRHLANRGGVALMLLLVVASMLLSFFGRDQQASGGLAPLVQRCFVDFAESSPLLSHLRDNVPDSLRGAVVFRNLADVPTDSAGVLQYPNNVVAIQLRPPESPGGRPIVWFWYPGDGSAIAPYEMWFWREAARAAGDAGVEERRSALKGAMDARTNMSVSLIVFGLFFVCVHLLPSLTCEERERGVLLAQALSPASTAELLGAKFLFYPALAISLAVVLAGVAEPRALVRPFFWPAVVVLAVGFMGVGLTVAAIATTQRAASLGAMCYLLAVSVFLMICGQNGIPFLPWLALEYHGPRMLYAALTDTVSLYHWGNLAGAALLAAGWAVTAGVLFRRRGWQ